MLLGGDEVLVAQSVEAALLHGALALLAGHLVVGSTEEFLHLHLALQLHHAVEDVVARAAYGHKLNAAAACAEGQRPQRVAAAPVDGLVEGADDDVGATLVELLRQLLQRLVVLEFLVGDGLDFGLSYFHSSAPFRQA